MKRAPLGNTGLMISQADCGGLAVTDGAVTPGSAEPQKTPKPPAPPEASFY